MKMSRSIRSAKATVAVLVAILCSGPLPAQQKEAPKTREQIITNLEKQVEALRKEIDALRKAAADSQVAATPQGAIPASWLKELKWRSIGPAGMGGRITAISVFEADPSTYWVATASGGLLKTENKGVTFTHQFDHQATVSIGDVCVAQSDKNIVWLGTGENNPRNSVSYGDGVYKSTDGGKTWTNMGLTKTFQIGRIVVHPKNPDIVYVGALGRLYGPNEERGLYKTTDGGKTWSKIHYIDDKTGVIDIAMHPADPETLLIATWERQRDEFDSHRGEPPLQDGYDAYDPIKKWGPGSGIFKTTDGGKTWNKLTKGLPTSHLGRVGLDYYRKDPNVIFAIIDCAKIGMGNPPSRVYLGVQGEDGGGGAKLTQIGEDSPASKAELKTGDVIKSIDKKPVTAYAQLAEQLRTRKTGEKVTLEVVRDEKTIEVAVTLEDRPLESAAGRSPIPALIGATGQDDEKGVRIVRVQSERAAEKAGIEEGDVIQSIDAKAVADSGQLATLLREKKVGDKLAIKVLRDDKPVELALTLEAPGTGTTSPTRPNGFMYGGQSPNIQDQQGPDGHEYGGVYRSADGGETWTRINSLNPRPMYFSQVRVDPSDEKYVYVLGVAYHRSKDGGKTFTADGGAGVHADGHALWIDPKDGRHMIVGTDGGHYQSWDRADNWEHLNHMAIAQFYHVALDNRQPYWAYGGLQDNGSWGGPSNGLNGVLLNEDWISVGGGDGFVCRVDPFDANIVYYESQNGAMTRRNLLTGERASLRPRTQRGVRYRFNWNTPFILSNHNPGIFYAAGNYVFRSVKRGEDLKAISPEIARTGRGTGTAIAESPRSADVLWAGTDDGHLWVTRDGGANWKNVADKVGLPGPRWVATVEPSRFADGRCYVAFDAHRSNDDEPYLYVTEDFGETWKSIRANLPTGSTRTLREDPKNQNLLFTGTEFALFASIDRGAHWNRLNNNLPTVAIHEIAIHPTAGELVAATHGRSLWITDVSPLRQMTSEIVKAPVHLYEPNSVVRWRIAPSVGMGGGAQRFRGENPPRAGQIFYSLAKKPERIGLKIVDVAGQTVRELQADSDVGLHQVTWDLSRAMGRGGRGGRGGGGSGRGSATAANQPEGEEAESAQPLRGRGEAGAGRGGARGGRGGAGGGRGGRGGRGAPVPAGPYRVVLTVDGKELSQTIRVEADPQLPAGVIPTVDEEVVTDPAYDRGRDKVLIELGRSYLDD
jgi:photosystem II stability/assembly factor-like uncharacterized protein